MLTLTFAQLKGANLSPQIISVNIYPNGDMYYKFNNPSADLRSTKPWSGKMTDDKAKALFKGLGTGTHYIEVKA
jgi:hypothetical protein